MRYKVPVWQMVKEAVESLGGTRSRNEIVEFIRRRYGDVNEGTINAHISLCTVNQPARVNFPINTRPRTANGRYDFLFSAAPGEYQLYHPAQHGLWEIRRNQQGRPLVARTEASSQQAPSVPAEPPPNSTDNLKQGKEGKARFSYESQLRDFLAQNLHTVPISGRRVRVFVDEQGRRGVEYQTPVGAIDILAIDQSDNLCVVELKLGKSEDTVVGQIQRYMGWVRANLPSGQNEVIGVIIAEKISDKLKFAASVSPNIRLCEYTVRFTVRPVDGDEA